MRATRDGAKPCSCDRFDAAMQYGRATDRPQQRRQRRRRQDETSRPRLPVISRRPAPTVLQHTPAVTLLSHILNLPWFMSAFTLAPVITAFIVYGRRIEMYANTCAVYTT